MYVSSKPRTSPSQERMEVQALPRTPLVYPHLEMGGRLRSNREVVPICAIKSVGVCLVTCTSVIDHARILFNHVTCV